MKKLGELLGYVIVIWIIAIIILGFVAVTKICIKVVFGATDTEVVHTEEYVVSDGDTLWTIASEYKKEGQDIREYVYQLRELNNIDCIIYPGQTIKIIK